MATGRGQRRAATVADAPAVASARELADVRAAGLALALRAAGQAPFELDLERGRLRLDAFTGSDREREWPVEQAIEHVHPDERDDVRTAVQRGAGAESAAMHVEFRVRGPGDVSWIWVHAAGRAVARGPDGRTRRLVGTYGDMTVPRQAEGEPREAAARFQRMLASMPEGYLRTDMEGVIESINPAACALLGHDDADELRGRSMVDAVYVDPAQRQGLLHALQLEDCLTEHEALFKRKDGSTFLASGSAFLVRDETGRPRYIEGTFRDVTASRRADAALRQSRERLSLALAAGGLALWDFSVMTSHLVVNARYAEMLGHDPDTFSENALTWLARIHPDDRDSVQAALASCVSGAASSYRVEFRMRGRTGRWVWIESMARVVEQLPDGRAARLVGTHADVTDRQTTRLREQAALRRNEALLQEIYHRVKNNLQVVASLLSMQGRNVPDQATRALFEESAARVKAMALVHEQLHRSSDLARIDLAVYLNRLVGNVAAHCARPDVHIEVATVPSNLSLESAVPCGLIVNELVTNACKHAFPDGRGGHVLVALSRVDEVTLELSVRDDGVGLPPEFDPSCSGNLGLRLVTSLARQLAAALELRREPPGLTWTLRLTESADESLRYAAAFEHAP
jgi:PAS domain S-box-containing protein